MAQTTGTPGGPVRRARRWQAGSWLRRSGTVLCVSFVVAMVMVANALDAYEEDVAYNSEVVWRHGQTWYGVRYVEIVGDTPAVVGIKSCGLERQVSNEFADGPVRVQMITCPGTTSVWYEETADVDR